MQNRADALFSAKRFHEAARQFEELATYLDRSNAVAKKDGKGETAGTLDDAKDAASAKPAAKDAKGAPPKDAKLAAVAAINTKEQSTQTVGEKKSHEEALYGALLCHYSSLKPGEVERLNAYEVADARQALKLMGASYIARYPRSEHALEVKFNIARAYFEDGDYPKSAELFRDFAITHPDHKDASVAGNLALDSLRQINDFKGIEATGKAFLASKLPASFLNDVRKILTETKSEALGELALQSSEETGDVVEGLLKVADENKGAEIGEKALYGAFSASRDKRDGRKEREIGERFMKEYPKSQYLSDVLNTLGRHAAEGGRYQEAAGYFETMGQSFKGEATGLDSTLAAARLRMAMGDYPAAMKALDAAAEQAGARKAEVLVLIAQTRMKMKEPEKARAVAEQVLKLDKVNSAAAAIVAEVQATSRSNEKPDALVALLTQVTNSPTGQNEETAKALWYLGEIMYRQYKALGADQVEQKVAMLQQLQGIYNQAASMGSAEWAVASLWRIGNGLQHIADTVEATPVPAGLSAAEVQQFRTAVKQQVDPLKEQANGAFQACLDRSEQLEVFTAAVVGCRKKTDEASNPLRGHPAERAVNADELQKKAEQTQNAADFEALGLAYLGGYQVKKAQMALTRAIELEDSRATAHNALGYALLLDGEANGARAEYGRALETDPTLEKARANIGALKCRFADTEGAKRELSVIKDTASLASPDVDPEWKSCR
ncbi:MAG: tetratricopeptide repeat protein [Myxococcaceae bacterium]|nr:tetratricopeptide repeat protein [Myxococcaceae bacterium]